jgi:SAM-dependent methyltransferase
MAGERQRRNYLDFWNDVGGNFPSLKQAASTRYYFECERALCERFFPPLQGLLVLKSDLWDEAKNTEILLWMAQQGARPAGIDIAYNIVHQAKKVLADYRPRLAAADVRSLPFPENTFDLIYSMGTIEHFADYGAAVRELHRVLKPSGIAIIGVPNKLDPFLRPLLVSLWNAFGTYPYGVEKSFTSRALRRLLESAGFQPIGRSGILFMPGWLRMLDLWCHVRMPRMARVTAWFVRPFAWAYRKFPALRRHGYLIVWAVSKPQSAKGLSA